MVYAYPNEFAATLVLIQQMLAEACELYLLTLTYVVAGLTTLLLLVVLAGLCGELLSAKLGTSAAALHSAMAAPASLLCSVRRLSKRGWAKLFFPSRLQRQPPF